MTTVENELPAFLRDAAGRQFRLGEWDCGLWLGAWYARATGRPDPALHLRGQYAAPDEWAALTGPLGLPRLISRLARQAGLKRTNEPKYGDIACLRSRPGSHVVGGIMGRRGWVVLAPGCGLSCIERAHVMAAWGWPHA